MVENMVEGEEIDVFVEMVGLDQTITQHWMDPVEQQEVVEIQVVMETEVMVEQEEEMAAVVQTWNSIYFFCEPK